MNIEEFEVVQQNEKVLNDFYALPHPRVEEINEDPGRAPPLMFYDNDDVFWDDEINKKMKKWGHNIKSDMIINRLYTKH